MEDGDGDWEEETWKQCRDTSAHGQQPEAQCSATVQHGETNRGSYWLVVLEKRRRGR